MAETTIQAIIDVEKDLQEKIAREKKKIAEWIDEKRQEIAGTIEVQEKQFNENQRRREENIKSEAAAQADKIIKEAELERARLEEIPQGEIERIVRQHLEKILPG